MEKRKKMRKWFHSLLLFCLTVTTIFSCRKMDSLSIPVQDKEVATKFLTLPPSTTPQVRRIAKRLKALNQRVGFLNTIAKRDGFAVWDKVIFNTNAIANKKRTATKSLNSNDTIIYIPLVLENTNYVNAFIYARLNGSIHLELHRAKDYESYGFGDLENNSHNADRLALQIMVLNKQVFGYTKFKLLDNRLFSNANANNDTTVVNRLLEIKNTETANKNKGAALSTSSRIVEGSVTHCTYSGESYHCTHTGNCTSGVCDGCGFCVTAGSWNCVTTVQYYFESETEDDPNSGGGGPDPNDGGGGNSSYNPYDSTACNPFPLLDNGLTPCPTGNSTGWMYLDIEGLVSDEEDNSLTNNDPNLDWWEYDYTDTITYTQQPRPSYQNMYNYYPKLGFDDLPVDSLCKLVGGQILLKYLTGDILNGCAIRVSRALNYSGVSIPNIPGQTWQGSDGKNYFYYAMHLYKFCLKTFGDPEVHKIAADGAPNGTNFQNQLIGIHNRGIYIMKPISQKDFKASGHATLWGGLNCIGGHNYFAAASDIFIWRLN